MKKYSKQQTFRNPTPDKDNSLEKLAEDLDGEEKKIKEILIKPKTPEIDEQILDGFDMRSQKIVDLIQSKD